MPTILHADRSNKPRTAFGAGPRRYIRSWLFRLAVTAFWRALTASWRQKGKQKQIFPRAIRTTELPSNRSPLTFRNNQIQILQTSSTHITMAANVFQQDTNTHRMWLSHARTRQSFFDTTHKKWSEWKTARSAVITGRFRRKRQGGGGLLSGSVRCAQGSVGKSVLCASVRCAPGSVESCGCFESTDVLTDERKNN